MLPCQVLEGRGVRRIPTGRSRSSASADSPAASATPAAASIVAGDRHQHGLSAAPMTEPQAAAAASWVHSRAGAPSGRTSSAPRPRMPIERALMASRARDGDRRPAVHRRLRRSRVGSREQREPGTEQVQRGHARAGGGHPDVRDAPAEVDVQLVGGLAGGAAGVGGAGDVVRGDRPPLGLVGVQQLGPGPAAQHPAELPAEVVAATDRGVHPGAAARGHAVGGVAGQEDVAGAEAVGQLGGEAEGAGALDRDVEVVDAGSGADPAHEALGRVALDVLRVHPGPVAPSGRRGRRAGRCPAPSG